MSYILKQYDTELLSFDMKKDIDGVSAHILSVNYEHKSLLPLDLELSDHGLAKWLKRRTIPSNRAYVQNFLAKLGLNEKDTKGIIDFCKGLSLNDCYWVVEENFNGKFADNNLYDNRFSNVLSHIAFTGYGSFQKSSLRSSPEFTTNGMLAKCWRRVDGKIVLYKSGTEGFANSGNEPYCEYYAYQVAEAMGINAVQYGLSKWKGRLCSTCELFTSKEYSFMPIGNIVKDGGIKAVIEYYKSLGDKYYDAFVDMIVFDDVILNTDRHFGNFGFMIDNRTNTICAPAPLFDHGLSLLTYAMDDDLQDWEAYAKTRVPATYSDFIELARQLMGHSQKEKLRKLINFKFKKHPRYNWPDSRLKTIALMLNNQVCFLLDNMF
jgi:hypothetical protein